MKKILIISVLSLSFSLLLLPFISFANQTMSNYYPSPSGTYAKVHLINGTNGPSENYGIGPAGSYCFCSQYSGNASGIKSGSFCDTGENVTYTNAGTIFADSTTGYMEICKADGSVASYPGSCFNRFGSGSGISSPPCPINYTLGKSQSFSMGGSPLTSWSCCFTGQGNDTAAQAAKSGCFAIYSNYPAQPTTCFAQDTNAYDIGCDTIQSSDMTPVFKRNCCYNISSPTYPLGTGISNVSICTCTPFNGTCTGWGPCSALCGSGTQSCLASTLPECGGTSAVGSIQSCIGTTPVNGVCTAWSACSVVCGSGTETCTASTAPGCGGASAVGSMQSCTGTTCSCSAPTPCGSYPSCTPDPGCGCGNPPPDACGTCGGSASACSQCPSTPCGSPGSCSAIPAGDCDCAGDKTGSPSCCSGSVGCDGVCNSGKVNDACGTCGGTASACSQCPSTPCGSPGSCTAIPAGDCDCAGDKTGSPSCCSGAVGCDGVCNSGKVNDACGKCGGSASACSQCSPNICGTPGACTTIPSGVCDCAGDKNDACGKCGGSATACSQCPTTPCGSPGSCSAIPAGDCDCAGDKTGSPACCSGTVGCDGVCNSGKTNDACGTCGGSASACSQCTSTICGSPGACTTIPNGNCNCTAQNDLCGTCGGSCTAANGDASCPSAQCCPSTPPAPGGESGSCTGTTATLTWTANNPPICASGYNVWLQDMGPTGSGWNYNNLSGTNSKTISSLNLGDTYNYNVFTATGSNWSSPSATGSFTCTCPGGDVDISGQCCLSTPPAPSGESGSCTGSTATLSWTANNPPACASDYNVWLQDMGPTGSGWNYNNLSPTNSETISSLNPGDTYNYNVFTATGSNWSSPSASGSFTCNSYAPVVGPYTCTGNGAEVTLTWSSVPSATAYNVYMYDTKYPTLQKIGAASSGGGPDTISSNDTYVYLVSAQVGGTWYPPLNTPEANYTSTFSCPSCVPTPPCDPCITTSYTSGNDCGTCNANCFNPNSCVGNVCTSGGGGCSPIGTCPTNVPNGDTCGEDTCGNIDAACDNDCATGSCGAGNICTGGGSTDTATNTNTSTGCVPGTCPSPSSSCGLDTCGQPDASCGCAHGGCCLANNTCSVKDLCGVCGGSCNTQGPTCTGTPPSEYEQLYSCNCSSSPLPESGSGCTYFGSAGSPGPCEPDSGCQQNICPGICGSTDTNTNTNTSTNTSTCVPGCTPPAPSCSQTTTSCTDCANNTIYSYYTGSCPCSNPDGCSGSISCVNNGPSGSCGACIDPGKDSCGVCGGGAHCINGFICDPQGSDTCVCTGPNACPSPFPAPYGCATVANGQYTCACGTTSSSSCTLYTPVGNTCESSSVSYPTACVVSGNTCAEGVIDCIANDCAGPYVYNVICGGSPV